MIYREVGVTERYVRVLLRHGREITSPCGISREGEGHWEVSISSTLSLLSLPFCCIISALSSPTSSSPFLTSLLAVPECDMILFGTDKTCKMFD